MSKETERIIEWIANHFDQPCNWTFDNEGVDEFMCLNNSEWCEEHCGTATSRECWGQYFLLKGVVGEV